MKVPARQSITSRLILIVLVLYTLVALLVTSSHVILEYRYQKLNIKRDLFDIQAAFKGAVKDSLWKMDQQALKEIVTGMLRIPSVIGIRVSDADGSMIAIGGTSLKVKQIEHRNVQVNLLGIKSENTSNVNKKFGLRIFSHSFVLKQKEKTGSFDMGKMAIYSSNMVIFHRMKLGLFLLVLNVIVTIITFCLALQWAVQRYLGRPLRELAQATEDVRLDNLDSFYVSIAAPEGCELKVFEKAFNAMVQNLNHTMSMHRQAENELRESEQRFDLAMNATRDGLWDWNLITNDIYYSPGWKSMLGYHYDELPNDVLVWENLIAPENTKLLKKMQQEVIGKSRDRFEFELKMKHKDGHWVDILSRANAVFDLDKNPIRLVGIHVNISERKRAEEALKKSEEKYRNIYENSIIGIFQSTPGGRFLSVNSAFARMLGYASAEELISIISDISKQYYVDSKDRLQYKQILQEFGSVENYIFKVQRKDGSQIWVSHNTRAFFDQDGKVLRYEGIVIDITKRKIVEEEKENLESQLRQTAKIEAVGTLAGGIAHDFNNILGIILGNAELALDDVPEWSPAKNNLNEIKTASMRAKNVVRQLLSFSRKSDQERKPLKITTVIKESIQLLRASIPTSVEFQYNFPTYLGTIMADPTQIHQIIINLCTNAAHAMEESGGVIQVSLAEIKVEEASGNHLQISPGRYIQLTIVDTGCGIDPKIKERIFDPYFTTKDVDKGTGIGLSVVNGIVKSHDGSIFVCSELNKGTTVEVLFPVIDENSVQKLDVLEALPRGNEKVLFVDDEKALTRMGQQSLERLGYQVEAFTNPVEALEQIRFNPNRFDLVITDMTMPQMNGDELAKEILSQQPNIPIILCTGYSERINKARAKEIGIRKYIEKPLNKRELSISVRELLDGLKDRYQQSDRQG